jgi:ABC-type multidrug transport system ATPase subunit
MITDPSIIFLDEPTSGLDSFRATSIVKLLAELAHKKGKTVIATIHSPNSSAFSYFDRLLLLMDGLCVYQGEANQITKYLEKIGNKPPRFANPADVFMKLFSVSYPKKEEDLSKITFFDEKYKELLNDQVI